MGLRLPQSTHRAASKDAPQAGQRAWVSKLSNGCPHRPQPQKGSMGGAAPHEGQANPWCRASAASCDNLRAC